MHSLNARVIVAELITERLDTATRARRYGPRRRRRFAREARRDAPSSSPVPPGRLRVADR
jgi:hypothetical protein